MRTVSWQMRRCFGTAAAAGGGAECITVANYKACLSSRRHTSVISFRPPARQRRLPSVAATTVNKLRCGRRLICVMVVSGTMQPRHALHYSSACASLPDSQSIDCTIVACVRVLQTKTINKASTTM